MGWGNSVEFQISRLSRFLFQLAAIGAILISADEVASIHETVSNSLGRFVNQFLLTTPMEDTRFFWVIPFGPLASLGLIIIVYELYRLIAQMPGQNNWQRQQAYIALGGSLLFLPGVFLSESTEWYLTTIKQFGSAITCFEEMFELLGMYGLFFCVMRISKQYQL